MEREHRAREGVAGAGALLLAAVVILLLAKGLYPADLPRNQNPDFVDNVFHNRGVLWAARLLLVSAAGVLAFGGIFIVLCIGIRMKNGEWLRRAGPFEISERRLVQVEDEADFWLRNAMASEGEVLHLRERLRQSEELLGDLQGLG